MLSGIGMGVVQRQHPLNTRLQGQGFEGCMGNLRQAFQKRWMDGRLIVWRIDSINVHKTLQVVAQMRLTSQGLDGLMRVLTAANHQGGPEPKPCEL